jgi:hypothetical protein
MPSLARSCNEKEFRLRWYKDNESTTLLNDQYEKRRHTWASHRTYGDIVANRRFRAYFQAVKREVSEVALLKSSSLEDRFHQLVCRWRKETRAMSSTTDKVLHPAYQDIIGMGQAVVPLILREMDTHGGHWFWALRHISQANPVPPEDAGKIPRMTEAWLRWGREHRYL